VVLVLVAVVALATTVEAVTGFGATILALTLGAQVVPLPVLLPALVPLNIALSAYLVLRHHDAVDRRELGRRILPLAALGLPLGFGLFVLAPGPWLLVSYGAFVVILALLRLVGALRPGEGPPPRRSPLWLVAGGVMQGLLASGGPLVVLYTAGALPEKRRFRSTMSALWLVLNLALASAHLAHGTLDGPSLRLTLALVPALVVGALIGEWLHARVSDRSFRIGVYALLGIAGAALISRA